MIASNLYVFFLGFFFDGHLVGQFNFLALALGLGLLDPGFLFSLCSCHIRFFFDFGRVFNRQVFKNLIVVCKGLNGQVNDFHPHFLKVLFGRSDTLVGKFFTVLNKVFYAEAAHTTSDCSFQNLLDHIADFINTLSRKLFSG
ncbi:hypothetical protein SDC9_176816 [bioreactor metagenome]|uniref:Uncharacterized protein n=1 Tax=bioreactor metagenome TaxID=1076179 RepID=A0A645H0G4_9ZZZZ